MIKLFFIISTILRSVHCRSTLLICFKFRRPCTPGAPSNSHPHDCLRMVGYTTYTLSVGSSYQELGCSRSMTAVHHPLDQRHWPTRCCSLETFNRVLPSEQFKLSVSPTVQLVCNLTLIGPHLNAWQASRTDLQGASSTGGKSTGNRENAGKRL